jgi:hypothetical protein
MEWLWPQTILVSLLYSALTLKKLRTSLRSWGSAVPGAELFESSINLKERGSAIAVSRLNHP